MPCTALKIERDGKINRIKFMTVAHEIYTDVDIFHCDENFIPVGSPVMGVDKRIEPDYHRELRKEAAFFGQFVPEESTNPEWNPGYVPDITDQEDPEDILP